MPSRSRGSTEFMLPFTIAVLLLMIGVVLFLRISNPAREERLAIQQRQLEELGTLINDVIPSTFASTNTSVSTLPPEELRSEPKTILAADGEPVELYLSKPKGNDPLPALIIVHGDHSSVRAAEKSSIVLGERLAASFNMLTASVHWRDDYADGDIKDIYAAVDWARTLTETKNQPLFLLGLDYGSYLSLRALTEKVDGVISAYGYIDPLQQYQHLQSSSQAQSAEAFLTQTGCDAAVRAESCLQDLSIYETLKVDVPLLIVQSTADTFVPIAQSDLLASLVMPEKLTYVPIEDTAVTHGFLASPNAAGFDEGLRQIQDWLTEQLKNRATAATNANDASENTNAAGTRPSLDEANEVETLE